MSEKGYLHRRSNNFGKVPFELMTDKAISAGAVRLYAYMHWRYGSNHDNHEARASMAEALGVSNRTIGNYLAELEQADWIVILPRTSKRGRASNYYHVFEYQQDCKNWRTEHRRDKPVREQKAKATRKGVGGAPTHKTKEDQQKSEVNPVPDKNSSSGTYSAGDSVNSSSDTPRNSSSDNPDSVDPDKRTIALDRAVAEKPKRTADPLFDLVALKSFDFKPGTAGIPGARIGLICRYLNGSDVQPKGRDLIPGAYPPAELSEVEAFYTWVEQSEGGVTLRDVQKFAEYFIRYRAQRRQPITLVQDTAAGAAEHAMYNREVA